MAPRIEAGSIEEHVRQQQQRILDAAMSLFREQGYRATDMEDIAGAVGLARNSLYRYYPNKDHILVACVQAVMTPYLARVRQLEAELANPAARILAWLDLQIDMATGPEHVPLMLMREIRSDAPDLRRDVMKLHQLPNDVLQRALREQLRGQRRDARLVAALIASMTETAAGQAIAQGGVAAVRRELRRSVSRLLENQPGESP